MTAIPIWPHMAIRVDALPPDADPDRRFYRCQDGCDYLTGHELRDSPVPHQVPDSAQLLSQHYGTDVTATPVPRPQRGAA